MAAIEKKRRALEMDIKKFYSDSSQILEPFAYLKHFYTRADSWDMCLGILFRHSATPERINRPTANVLMYSALTLKLQAYGGFKHLFDNCLVDKHKLLGEISDRLLTLVNALANTHPRIAAQLSSVVASIVIYGFEATHSASQLLFLQALSKTDDGSIAQYLLLTAVASEAMADNVAVHLNHRSSFIRVCVSLAPKVFAKLVASARHADICTDHFRLASLTEWLKLHSHLLRVFYPLALEQRFLESYELVFEDLVLPTKTLSDLELIHRSLEALDGLQSVELLLNFLKYGIASEDDRINNAASELASHLLSLCQVDLAGLLMLSNQKCSELLDVKDRDERWTLACQHALANLSPLIVKITSELTLGLCKIGASLLVCGEPEKKLQFLRHHTSRCLLDLFIQLAREHLPLALHFGLVKDHHVSNFCRFVNLYTYSDCFSLRKSALDFWDVFQEHLFPPRKDLSFLTTSALETIRPTLTRSIRPCFEYFVSDLYKSCIISDRDDFEAIILYRELAMDALRKAIIITGPDIFVKLIREDLDDMMVSFHIYKLERCTFFTSVLASRPSSDREVIKSVVLIALDMMDLRKIPQSKKRPINFYRISLFRLVLWTSALIAKDPELFLATNHFLTDQVKATKPTNMPLDAHVHLDQAVLAVCFCLKLTDPLRRTLIDYLSGTIGLYIFPLEKRLEIFEGFTAIVEASSQVESLQSRYNIVKRLYYQVYHIKNITEMAESYLFLMAAMSSINFTNPKELRLDFVTHITQFLLPLVNTEDLWRYVAEVIMHTTVVDQSHHELVENTVQNCKTSFLIWLFSNSKHSFIQLPVVKILLSQNIIQTCTRLFELLIAHITTVSNVYKDMLKSNSHPADQHAIDLMDSISLIMVRWELASKLFEWKEFGEFILELSNSMPRKLSNLNQAGYSVIAKFVGWADFPKQLITNIDQEKYQIFKNIKTRARDILNGVETDSGAPTVVHNVIDAIFRATVSRADRMDSWLKSASQTISVLTKCSQTQQNTQVALKSIMDERCIDMSPLHINFYHKKLLQAKGWNDVRIILTIISDYHFCKFTMY